jgi:hypothetical protein
MVKIQKRLKSKQRQQERKWLLLRAYLSFVVSFFFYAFGIFNTRAKDCIKFYLCKKKFF